MDNAEWDHRAESLYRDLIVEWIYHIQTKNTNKNKSPQNSENYFKQIFLPKLKTISKLKITFDEIIAKVMMRMLKEKQYNQITNHKNVRIEKKPSKAEIISQICQELYRQNFISKSMMTQIKRTQENSLQMKMDQLLTQLGNMKKPSEGQLQQKWAQILGQRYSMQYMWEDIILPNLNILDLATSKNLYKFYRPLLMAKKHEKLIPFFVIKFQLPQISKPELLHHLMQIQERKCERIKQLKETQLKQLFNNIETGLKLSFPKISVNFQIFGSIRSGFFQSDSDFDLSLFCKQEQHHLTIPHATILTTISDYLCSVRGYVKTVQNVLKSRIPVIKLQLNNKIVRNVDIVLNNAHGVQNSQFLSQFSKNVTVKMFVNLVKKWAKKYDLVGPSKFSSYGITLMVIYYLMRFGKIQHAQRYYIHKKVQSKRGNRNMKEDYQKPILSCNNKLIRNVSLFEDFDQFLSFYSQEGSFFKNPQFVCLLQKEQVEKQEVEQMINYHNGCHRRVRTNNFYLINMHDPFDDSNPGRFKQSEKQLFFEAINQTKFILRTQSNQPLLQMIQAERYQ